METYYVLLLAVGSLLGIGVSTYNFFKDRKREPVEEQRLMSEAETAEVVRVNETITLLRNLLRTELLPVTLRLDRIEKHLDLNGSPPWKTRETA